MHLVFNVLVFLVVGVVVVLIVKHIVVGVSSPEALHKLVVLDVGLAIVGEAIQERGQLVLVQLDLRLHLAHGLTKLLQRDALRVVGVDHAETVVDGFVVTHEELAHLLEDATFPVHSVH